jgi:hypothetical protein
VRARRLGQLLLVFVPLFICAARLHAGAARSPSGVSQEVSRCLNMVRVVASRRNGRGAPATGPARSNQASASPTRSIG